MATAGQTATQAPRISAEDAKRRLEGGEPATILDLRNPKVWGSSNMKIRGAIRLDPDQSRFDPAWPKNRFTLVY
jgi:hypothetical protein